MSTDVQTTSLGTPLLPPTNWSSSPCLAFLHRRLLCHLPLCMPLPLARRRADCGRFPAQDSGNLNPESGRILNWQVVPRGLKYDFDNFPPKSRPWCKMLRSKMAACRTATAMPAGSWCCRSYLPRRFSRYQRPEDGS